MSVKTIKLREHYDEDSDENEIVIEGLEDGVFLCAPMSSAMNFSEARAVGGALIRASIRGKEKAKFKGVLDAITKLAELTKG